MGKFTHFFESRECQLSLVSHVCVFVCIQACMYASASVYVLLCVYVLCIVKEQENSQYFFSICFLLILIQFA